MFGTDKVISDIYTLLIWREVRELNSLMQLARGYVKLRTLISTKILHDI